MSNRKRSPSSNGIQNYLRNGKSTLPVKKKDTKSKKGEFVDSEIWNWSQEGLEMLSPSHVEGPSSARSGSNKSDHIYSEKVHSTNNQDRELLRIKDCWSPKSSCKDSTKVLRYGRKLEQKSSEGTENAPKFRNREEIESTSAGTDDIVSKSTQNIKYQLLSATLKNHDIFEEETHEKTEIKINEATPSNSCDESDADDNSSIFPRRKKLRSEINKDELWEGFPQMRFKRLTPKKKTEIDGLSNELRDTEEICDTLFTHKSSSFSNMGDTHSRNSKHADEESERQNKTMERKHVSLRRSPRKNVQHGGENNKIEISTAAKIEPDISKDKKCKEIRRSPRNITHNEINKTENIDKNEGEKISIYTYIPDKSIISCDQKPIVLRRSPRKSQTYANPEIICDVDVRNKTTNVLNTSHDTCPTDEVGSEHKPILLRRSPRKVKRELIKDSDQVSISKVDLSPDNSVDLSVVKIENSEIYPQEFDQTTNGITSFEPQTPRTTKRKTKTESNTGIKKLEGDKCSKNTNTKSKNPNAKITSSTSLISQLLAEDDSDTDTSTILSRSHNNTLQKSIRLTSDERIVETCKNTRQEKVLRDRKVHVETAPSPNGRQAVAPRPSKEDQIVFDVLCVDPRNAKQASINCKPNVTNLKQTHIPASAQDSNGIDSTTSPHITPKRSERIRTKGNTPSTKDNNFVYTPLFRSDDGLKNNTNPPSQLWRTRKERNKFPIWQVPDKNNQLINTSAWYQSYLERNGSTSSEDATKETATVDNDTEPTDDSVKLSIKPTKETNRTEKLQDLLLRPEPDVNISGNKSRNEKTSDNRRMLNVSLGVLLKPASTPDTRGGTEEMTDNEHVNETEADTSADACKPESNEQKSKPEARSEHIEREPIKVKMKKMSDGKTKILSNSCRPVVVLPRIKVGDDNKEETRDNQNEPEGSPTSKGTRKKKKKSAVSSSPLKSKSKSKKRTGDKTYCSPDKKKKYKAHPADSKMETNKIDKSNKKKADKQRKISVSKMTTTTRRRSLRSPIDIADKDKVHKRKPTDTSELLGNIAIGKHASTLWLSEHRRHLCQKYSEKSPDEMEKVMIEAWQKVGEKEKLKYFQRAECAMNDENRHSIPKKVRDKEDTLETKVAPVEVCKKMSQFTALDAQGQHDKLRWCLRQFHEISPSEYAKLMAEFKDNLKHKKPKHKGRSKAKDDDDMLQSQYRKLMYQNILDRKDKIIEIYQQKKERQSEFIRDNFHTLTKRLIAGEEIPFAASVRSEQLDQTLSDLRLLESESLVTVTGDVLKSRSYESVLDDINGNNGADDVTSALPHFLSSLEYPSTDYADELLKQACCTNELPELNTHDLDEYLDADDSVAKERERLFSPEVFQQLSQYFETEAEINLDLLDAVSSNVETQPPNSTSSVLTDWMLSDQFKMLSKNFVNYGSNIQMAMKPTYLNNFLGHKDYYGQPMTPSYYYNPYYTSSLRQHLMNKNQNSWSSRRSKPSKYDVKYSSSAYRHVHSSDVGMLYNHKQGYGSHLYQYLQTNNNNTDNASRGMSSLLPSHLDAFPKPRVNVGLEESSNQRVHESKSVKDIGNSAESARVIAGTAGPIRYHLSKNGLVQSIIRRQIHKEDGKTVVSFTTTALEDRTRTK